MGGLFSATGCFVVDSDVEDGVVNASVDECSEELSTRGSVS